ncbi:MAG: tRNA (adenosine(37)-N6)-threonylcarbamoyltransferase complex dimerization subunit type 1 TsaB [Alphaproteobacteria bacterium]
MLLAIDCATDACSAALWLGGAPGPRRFALMRHGHAEALMPMIQEVMNEAGLAFSELDEIAATVGPGAFTGLRIGLAAARGIALATGRPLIGVTTLEAVAAAQATQGRPLLVALGSRRADVYVQFFDSTGAANGEPRVILPGDVGGILPPGKAVALAGDAADAVLSALGGHQPAPVRLAGPDLPDAAFVARIAADRATQPEAARVPPKPLYLRPPDAITAADRKARLSK